MTMDRLSYLLDRLSLSAGAFHAGNICGAHSFDPESQAGHIHVVRAGPVRLLGGAQGGISITQPSLLFMPRATAHRLVADDRDGADVVCASVRFGAGGRNPVTDSLPALLVVPLDALPGSGALLDLIHEEACSDHGGRQTSLDRLCELLLIRLLRYCLEQGVAKGGALSGLADPRLAKALAAIHEDPARAWELSDMASLAGMSRARFAVHFREVTGDTPANYLAAWRISLAQALLRTGRALKHVASDVGYGSPSALTRAFVRMTGSAPRAWLRQVQPQPAVDQSAGSSVRLHSEQVRFAAAAPEKEDTRKGTSIVSSALPHSMPPPDHTVLP